MVFDSLKTFVARSAGNKVGNALTTSTGAAAPSLSNVFNHARELANKLLEEKEWQCPCGHKFRASGEWVACAAIYCEVPSCPNPKYYIDGPGRALLEANPSGVKLQQITPGNVQKSASSPKSPVGVGSRFR